MYPRSYSSSTFFHFQYYVEEHQIYEQMDGNMGEYIGKVSLRV